MNDEMYAIFGAGEYGKRVLEKYKGKVKYFIDNNASKQGQFIDDIPIISFENFIHKKTRTRVIIGGDGFNRYRMEQQLKRNGIKDYLFCYFTLCDPNELVINNYEGKEDHTEDDWNNNLVNVKMEDKINEYVDMVKEDAPLFNNIEIETINSCNGTCSFCPVNKLIDPREKHFMQENLFYKIITELAELNYSGRLALFSNNEPFIDNRIIEFSKYARKELPYAQIHLFTNGTLLSLDKFLSIIDYLDELIIDNYDKNLQLIEPCVKIKEYIENHRHLIKKVSIIIRNPEEILTSRGGDAPNRKKLVSYEKSKCALPFQQFIVRPDGKVSLCCNDPLGKCTMGDLNQQTISEIWYGHEYTNFRDKLEMGRKNWSHCEYCDTFMLF